ncbi:MAG: ABC transporter ATP-binding protein [Rhodothermales bacterium]|nr:ABC transporter ATP-binding protein [Rhodothermales bacterium]
MSKKEPLKRRLRLVGKALGLVWQSAPRWTVSWAILLVVQGALPAVTVYVSKLLIDTMVAGLDDGGATWELLKPVAVLAGVMGALLLATHILSSILRWVRVALSETFRDYLRGRLHEKAVELDLEFYETSAYHDRLYRVMGDVAQRPVTMLESLGSLVQSTVTILGLAVLIVTYAWWLPLLLFVGALPALAVAMRFSRRRHAWWMRRTQDERWTQYYETVLTHSSIAAEVRLFDLGTHFKTLYQELRARLRDERVDLERKHVLENIAAGLLALFITAGVMIWITLRAFRGAATLGDIALFYQAFSRGQNLMRSILLSVNQVYDSSLFVSELFDFFALKPMASPERTPSQVRKVPGSVEFENVSFAYPASNDLSLNDVSVTFKRNQTVAIVGENGAGKSTLLKLLCRFYDPKEGRVLVDGTPLSQIPLEDARRLLTVLFQFPVQYHASAAQNIAYGEVSGEIDSARIREAARLAGIDEKIESLPAGYETLLGKWFVDGQELSGGEWQRLAMARAYYRDAPIIVLDEPTSMLDSWAEADWFERFRSLAQDRIGIVITHRFTIARRADVIHVMQAGRIVESGSHQDLLSLGGLYAASWQQQVEGSPDHT